MDTGGQASGLGSRYFWIQNAPGSPPSGIEAEPALHVSSEGILHESAPEYTDIKIVTGYKVQAAKSRVSPNAAGVYTVVLEDLDRLEIELAPDERKEDIERFEGYMEHRGRLFKLPVGSAFDAKNGVFYWMPGPAFMGEYDLVFLKEGKNKARTRKQVKVRVGRMPKNPKAVFLGGLPPAPVEETPLPNGPAVRDEAFGIGDIAAQEAAPAGDAVVLADPLVPTYYIYTHDGKLLAEYDKNGGLVRDYIYFGNMLIAEYRPGPKYYYYTLDQINSTRMITNDTGAVVYSAAHGPYGAIEKTWTNSYDPALKFSGKEREKGSGLDYFGARYYGHTTYRWLSPDPVRTRDAALSNPQLWNLYAYCRNSPITYWDPDGRVEVKFSLNISRVSSDEIYRESRGGTRGGLFKPNYSISVRSEKSDGEWTNKVTIDFKGDIFIPGAGDAVYGKPNMPKNESEALEHEMGHLLLGMLQMSKDFRNATILESITSKYRIVIEASMIAFRISEAKHTAGYLFANRVLVHPLGIPAPLVFGMMKNR